MEISHHIAPRSLTFITTYRCTAACSQCCFESSPTVKGRLSRQYILDTIQEVKRNFPSLEVVVFTGGEATLLKQDLIDGISAATGESLVTRIVSNGSWGKTLRSADRVASSLAEAGLRELNISTGKDHQEWVPVSSVINAAEAAIKSGIWCLITVEADTADGARLAELVNDPRIQVLRDTRGLQIQTNSWMNFKTDPEARIQRLPDKGRRQPCEQIFNNVVVTPYHEVSACCGLTLEHIPEMKLGVSKPEGVAEAYRTQQNDFLKYWIRVDGPYEIIRRLVGDQRAAEILQDSVHICQDCIVLHKNEEILKQLTARYQEFEPEVMSRYVLSKAVENLSNMAGPTEMDQ